MSARAIERELAAMLDEFGRNPTEEERARYRTRWEEWLAARGMSKPVTRFHDNVPRDVVAKRPEEVPHARQSRTSLQGRSTDPDVSEDQLTL